MKSTLLEDRLIARNVLGVHARAHGVDFDAATLDRTPRAAAARHAAWRELRNERRWSLPRIARAFGCHHTTIMAALKKTPPTDGCPVCGAAVIKTTVAPLTYVCGVATSRAFHHAGGAMCVVQTAWVHLGDSSPAGAA